MILFGLLPLDAQATDISLNIGTDIPYQLHIGSTIDRKKLRVSLRSGILFGPYSQMTIGLVELLGTPEVYVSILESAYQFGSMNALALQYAIGNKQNWYIGPEMRFDYLMASDTGSELIEAVLGQDLSPKIGAQRDQELLVDLGLMMYAVGLRFTRQIPFTKKHALLVELSIYKHYQTKSSLYINEETPENLDTMLNDLLWKDVFLPYGYLGGFGMTYHHTF